MAKAVIEALVARFPDDVYEPYEGVGGDDCAFVRKDGIARVCGFLKADPAMGFNLAPHLTDARSPPGPGPSCTRSSWVTRCGRTPRSAAGSLSCRSGR